MDGDLDNDGVVEGPSCQGGSCDGGFLYEIYTYGGDCNSGDRTFTLTDTETNEVAWSITMNQVVIVSTMTFVYLQEIMMCV